MKRHESPSKRPPFPTVRRATTSFSPPCGRIQRRAGANIEWTRDTYTALQPFFSHRRYVNYLEDEAGDDPIRDAYGPNYERLTRLKAKYDFGNLFRVNQNIEPRPKES